MKLFKEQERELVHVKTQAEKMFESIKEEQELWNVYALLKDDETVGKSTLENKGFETHIMTMTDKSMLNFRLQDGVLLAVYWGDLMKIFDGVEEALTRMRSAI